MHIRRAVPLMLLSILAAPTALRLHAQQADAPATPPAQPPHAAANMNTREGITDHEHRKYAGLVKNLALTPDQQTQVKAVLDNRLAEEMAAFDSPPDVKGPRMKEIDAESRSKVRAMLNPDQLAKYNKALQDEADRNAARKAAAAGNTTGATPAAAPAATTAPAPQP